MKTPTLGISGLCGRVYIITRVNKDGSAARKYEVTDLFDAIAKERAKWKARETRRKNSEKKEPANG